MVNTGKPSSGCRLCRARRVKCDETKPACLKCQRSQRQCPGYGAASEARIRDQTQAVIRKVKQTRVVIEKDQVLQTQSRCDEDCSAVTKENTSSIGAASAAKGNIDWANLCLDVHRRGSATSTGSASVSPTTHWAESIHQDFWAGLVTPLDQRAACYLLSEFVLVSDAPGKRKGYYKFAYKILIRPIKPSACLLSAFRAVSMVALSSRPGASHLVTQAESHYLQAIREVNRAIQDPKQVKADDTLASVLLLALYETLASKRDRLDEYISHIKGAAQLVKIRGPKQTDRDVGAEMFSMTRNQFLAIRAMAPSEDSEDYSWLLRQYCADAHISRIAMLTITCSEIRMKTDQLLAGGQRHLSRLSAVLDVLRTAQALSKKLSNLVQPHSETWQVQKKMVSVTKSDSMEAAVADEYKFHNLYACMIYAITWTSHLFLTTCIFRCMAWLVTPGDWQTGDEYNFAVEASKTCIRHIVASMQYACSWNGYNTESDFVCGESIPSSPAKGVAGMCIYRPAFTAMMSDFATPQQKKYLHSRLKFLADSIGIKQVNVLLNLQHQAAHPSMDIERDRRR